VKLGLVIVCAILAGFSFMWLDGNVEWVHNLTPKGKHEAEERRLNEEARAGFYSRLEHTRRWHAVVVPGEEETSERDPEDGAFISYPVIRFQVRQFLQAPEGAYLETYRAIDLNNPYGPMKPRPSFSVYQVDAKFVKTPDEQRLWVETARQRLNLKVKELQSKGNLNEKESMELIALQEAASREVLMRGKVFEAISYNISTRAYSVVDFPLPFRL